MVGCAFFAVVVVYLFAVFFRYIFLYFTQSAEGLISMIFLSMKFQQKQKQKNKKGRKRKKKREKKTNVKYNDVNKFRIATPRKKKEKKGQAVPQEC